MKDYVVIDNLVTPYYADYLEQKFLSANYYYNYNITTYKQDGVYRPGFSHLISKDGNSLSHYYETVMALFSLFCGTVNIEPKSILRSSLFLQLPVKIDFHSSHIHRDTEADHLVFLYYVTNSEGPTKIYSHTSEYDDEKTVLHTIEPKKGRCLLFNGKHFHSSSTPERTTRLVLNVDFK